MRDALSNSTMYPTANLSVNLDDFEVVCTAIDAER